MKLGLPISEVEFPSVVICSEGFDFDGITAILWLHILNNMNTTTYEKLGLSPLQCAKLGRKFTNGVSFFVYWHSKGVLTIDPELLYAI